MERRRWLEQERRLNAIQTPDMAAGLRPSDLASDQTYLTEPVYLGALFPVRMTSIAPWHSIQASSSLTLLRRAWVWAKNLMAACASMESSSTRKLPSSGNPSAPTGTVLVGAPLLLGAGSRVGAKR